MARSARHIVSGLAQNLYNVCKRVMSRAKCPRGFKHFGARVRGNFLAASSRPSLSSTSASGNICRKSRTAKATHLMNSAGDHHLGPGCHVAVWTLVKWSAGTVRPRQERRLRRRPAAGGAWRREDQAGIPRRPNQLGHPSPQSHRHAPPDLAQGQPFREEAFVGRPRQPACPWGLLFHRQVAQGTETFQAEHLRIRRHGAALGLLRRRAAVRQRQRWRTAAA